MSAAGGKAISNGSFQWACVRYNPSDVWLCSGAHGCLRTTTMFYTWLVASPLSLHILDN